MKKVSKSELKAKMFEHFRELEQSGGVLIVTDYGERVLQISPIKKQQSLEKVFADLRGKVKIDRALALDSTMDEWESK